MGCVSSDGCGVAFRVSEPAVIGCAEFVGGFRFRLFDKTQMAATTAVKNAAIEILFRVFIRFD